VPHDRLSMRSVVRAGLRQSPWQTAAGLLAATVVSGALLAALTLLAGMDRLLGAGLTRLGADVIVTPRGQGFAVEQLLRTGQTARLGATISVDAWSHKLKVGRVVGIKSLQGWSLADGGMGKPTDVYASILLVRLERWAAPLIAREEIAAALPEADVVMAEQGTRQVARGLVPLVRYLTIAAGVALLAGLLLTGLLTSIRVAQRRGELGMLRAIGATRLWITALTLAETGIVALSGATLGLVAVTLLGVVMEQPRSLLAPLTGLEVGVYTCGAAGLTLGVALLAALGPALRAAAMDPLDAARQGQ